jgi:hypothetical protein
LAAALGAAGAFTGVTSRLLATLIERGSLSDLRSTLKGYATAAGLAASGQTDLMSGRPKQKAEILEEVIKRRSGGGEARFHIAGGVGDEYAKAPEYDFDATGITEANAQEMQSIKSAAQANGTFMKSPNGKKSNLNERQWLQVRTNAFKQWFGDWELANKLQLIEDLAATNILAHNLTDEQLFEAYKNIGEVRNKKDNRNVKFVNSTYGKIIRHKGVDTKKIVPQLKEVFEHAVPIYSEDVKEEHKEHKNFVGYHNYLGKIRLGGKGYYVRFTTQEEKTSSKEYNPNQLHSTFISDIELYENENADTSFPRLLTGASVAGISDAKLQQFFRQAIEAREASSKVVDENGEPLPVAHSTNKEFTVFRNKQEKDSGWLGGGYYFFGDRSLDGQYGKIGMEVFLNIRSPYYATYEEMERLSDLNDQSESERFTQELKEAGHDGVYFNGNTCVFWGGQKSAEKKGKRRLNILPCGM